jgi:phospholipase C
MKRYVEKTYGKALRGIFHAVNPVKKMVMKTHCTVHKFINIQGIEILRNEGYNEAYDFYKGHIRALNLGVTWADQDLKSSNHFYHYKSGKGLYGFSDALTECKKYYGRAQGYMDAGDADKAMFWLGAACHLIQDTNVPQHVNNKLLKSHRRFELWIIGRLMSDYTFATDHGMKRFESLKEYIINNAKEANSTYMRYKDIAVRDERYHKVAAAILHEAQRVTAGVMLDFYETTVLKK